MQTFQTLQRGYAHPQHCEDHIFVERPAANLWIGAVFDGCSSGRDSYFASALLGKLLNKVMASLPYLQVIGFDVNNSDLSAVLRSIALALFNEVKQSKANLHLHKFELLSTIMLAVYRPLDKELAIMASADGVFAVNGAVRIVEQGQAPNYMAYHLEGSAEEWYERETEQFFFNEVSSFAISTDGVSSFAPESLADDREPIEAVPYLLTDRYMIEDKAMLHKKVIILHADHQLIHRDDIGIIRVENT